jgi:hypothetical protein
MGYSWLADGIAFLHGLFTAFLVLGPIWAWRRAGVRAFHLFCLWFTFVLAATGHYCPMVSFENSLRTHYDPRTAYSSGFIVRYIGPLVWWDLTEPQVVAVMAAWTVTWTLIYVFWWRRERASSL